MFFSSREWYNYLNSKASEYEPRFIKALADKGKKKEKKKPRISFAEASASLTQIKKAIVARKDELYADGADEYDDDSMWLGKWLRPWEVVPELKDFKAPKGDFGIGVEVEVGFKSTAALNKAVKYIQNWKYITLDEEGGDIPLEVTFPPILYSEVSNTSLCMKYLAFLKKHDLVTVNNQDWLMCGIHINVSKGGVKFNRSGPRLLKVNRVLNDLTPNEETKYFGRCPYGYGNCTSNKYIEWKLFNSVADPQRLQQYIDIAVELTALVCNRRVITVASVKEALELGFNKSLPQKKAA